MTAQFGAYHKNTECLRTGIAVVLEEPYVLTKKELQAIMHKTNGSGIAVVHAGSHG